MPTDMNTPQIRFKGFTEEWKKDIIGNLTSSYSGGTPSVSNHEYYGGSIPFIRSGEVHEDKTELFITAKGLSESSAKMVSKGQILYALYGATSGEVDICKINGAINQAILAIDSNDDIMNSFLCPLLQEKKSHIINTLIQGGQGNLSGTLVKGYNIAFPSIAEQEKIASFFKSLDSMIDATAKKVASLKQTKQGCLQSMFPQEGETTPKVRFKGFTGDWENNYIDEVCKITTGQSNTQDQKEDGKYPFFIRSEKIAKSNRYLYDLEAVITIGDGNIGKVFHYINGKFDLHQRCYMMYNFNPDIYPKYFYYYFATHFYDRVIKMSAKATVDSVRLDMIAKMAIKMPSYAEQTQIASFFSNLDKQIELQEQKLEKLKQIKSACLNKMFI